MVLYISTYESRGYLVPNGPNKIPITPKLSTPKLFLHIWKFLKYHLGRNTLYNLDNPRRRIPRRCRQKQMDGGRSPGLLIFRPFPIRTIKLWEDSRAWFSAFFCRQRGIYKVNNREAGSSWSSPFLCLLFFRRL